jgi:hypothetical protein
MKESSHDVSVCVLLLRYALICLMTGCAEAPKYYWMKSGTTTEQILKDNTFCADMTAEKPASYARGSAFYYAPLDQPAYQRCMRELGYRKLTEEEVNRERFAAAAAGPLLQLDGTRKLCQRVTGSDGDIESCIRYMSVDVRGLRPSPGPPPIATSQMGDVNVCLRRESNESRQWKMVVNPHCGEHPQKIE